MQPKSTPAAEEADDDDDEKESDEEPLDEQRQEVDDFMRQVWGLTRIYQN